MVGLISLFNLVEGSLVPSPSFLFGQRKKYFEKNPRKERIEFHFPPLGGSMESKATELTNFHPAKTCFYFLDEKELNSLFLDGKEFFFSPSKRILGPDHQLMWIHRSAYMRTREEEQ